jgi:hypothetical protein
VDEEGIGQPTPAHVAAQSVAAQSGDEGGLRVPLELGAARAFRPATTKPQASALQYGTSDRTYQSDLVIYITLKTDYGFTSPDLDLRTCAERSVCWRTSAPSSSEARVVAK